MELKIRTYRENDFTKIQDLYKKEGWLTVIKREDDAKLAFKNSNIVLVATFDDNIIGFLRALSDTQITTYIAELVVDKEFRKKGVAKQLIDYCHQLYPSTRLDVLASDESKKFYIKQQFKTQNGYRKSYI